MADPNVAEKRCSHCRETKPIAMFQLNAAMRDGFQHECRTCRAARQKTEHTRQQDRERYRKVMADPEAAARRREARRLWNAANPEKVKTFARRVYASSGKKRQAAWATADRERNPEKYAERHKRYKAEHSDRLNDSRRRTREKTREQRLKYNAEYREKNRDALNAKGREYRERNRQRELERSRQYHAKRPEVAYKNTLAYRARKRGAFEEAVEPLVVFERDKWRCHLCGRKVSRRHASIDHVVPLSKGGAHSYANCKTAHLKCNMSKGAKVIGQPRLVG